MKELKEKIENIKRLEKLCNKLIAGEFTEEIQTAINDFYTGATIGKTKIFNFEQLVSEYAKRDREKLPLHMRCAILGFENSGMDSKQLERLITDYLHKEVFEKAGITLKTEDESDQKQE